MVQDVQLTDEKRVSEHTDAGIKSYQVTERQSFCKQASLHLSWQCGSGWGLNFEGRKRRERTHLFIVSDKVREGTDAKEEEEGKHENTSSFCSVWTEFVTNSCFLMHFFCWTRFEVGGFDI